MSACIRSPDAGMFGLETAFLANQIPSLKDTHSVLSDPILVDRLCGGLVAQDLPEITFQVETPWRKLSQNIQWVNYMKYFVLI